MKKSIHPDYGPAVIRCVCGHSFETRSVKSDIHVEICSNCHPFFTGKQKLVDTAGRIEKFNRRYKKSSSATSGATASQNTAKSAVQA